MSEHNSQFVVERAVSANEAAPGLAEKLNAAANNDPFLVQREEVIQYLVVRGLTAEKAGRFLDRVVFSKRDADLFDAPFIRTVAGGLFLCAGIARWWLWVRWHSAR